MAFHLRARYPSSTSVNPATMKMMMAQQPGVPRSAYGSAPIQPSSVRQPIDMTKRSEVMALGRVCHQATGMP